MKSEANKHLSKVDPHLKHIIASIPYPRIESSKNVFLDLCGCIVEQQIQYRAKGIMMKKLFDLLNGASPTPDKILALDEEAFSQKKLSNLKYQTLLRVANYWKNKNLDSIDWANLTDEEIRSLLGDIKGVGNWTVDMILLYTLERPDIFPYDDYHLKKIMVNLYELNPKSRLKAQMLDIANDWKPYRSAAVKYLLAWKKHLQSSI